MKSFCFRSCLILVLSVSLSSPVLAARLIAMDDDNGEFFEIDPAVPSATSLGTSSTGVSLSGLTWDSASGRLWVSDTCGEYCYGLGWVDLDTWQITEVGAFTDTSNIHAIAYDPDQDILFGWDEENDQLVSLNRNTGAETYLGATDGPNIVGMTYDPVNNRLLGVSRADDTLYAIDTSTYAVTAIGALGIDAGGQFGLVWDPDSNRLYLGTLTGLFYELNPATGVATLLGDTGELLGALAAITVSVPYVPSVPVSVPTTSAVGLALLILSMLLVAGTVGFRRFS